MLIIKKMERREGYLVLGYFIKKFPTTAKNQMPYLVLDFRHFRPQHLYLNRKSKYYTFVDGSLKRVFWKDIFNSINSEYLEER